MKLGENEQLQIVGLNTNNELVGYYCILYIIGGNITLVR